MQLSDWLVFSTMKYAIIVTCQFYMKASVTLVANSGVMSLSVYISHFVVVSVTLTAEE